MAIQPQDNLWSVEKMQTFYNSHKTSIDAALKSFVTNNKPYWGDANYAGMKSTNGKPHNLNATREYLLNNKTIFDVCAGYSKTGHLKKLRETYPALEGLISAFVFIESKFDNRANLAAPRPTAQAKGLVQIQRSNASAYPDFSNKIADFSKIPTHTKYGYEPANSVYNTWKSVERVLVFLDRYTDSIKRVAGNVSPNNRKYPVAGWALYCYWNQGPGGGSRLINLYLNNPNAPISSLSALLKNNLSYNTFGKGVPSTVGEWFERMRLQYNIGQYLACNNCVARVYKNSIENAGGKVVGNQISKDNITCPPLSKSDFRIQIGSFVRR